MKVEYAPSSKLSAKRAGEAAVVFQQIQRTGPLTPDRVLASATSKRSPLHNYFDWDDKIAGHKHRLNQARELIASVKIRIRQDPKAKPKTIRAFVRVLTKRGPAYVDTLAALSDEDHRAQVVAQALAELQAFERKYKDLVELSEIFIAIQKVKRRKAA